MPPSLLLVASGDMVWNALVIVTVLLPLAGLAIDVPRYFALRSRLQIAADAARKRRARQVDIAALSKHRAKRAWTPTATPGKRTGPSRPP